MHILELFSLVIVVAERQNMQNGNKTPFKVILNINMMVKLRLLVIFMTAREL